MTRARRATLTIVIGGLLVLGCVETASAASATDVSAGGYHSCAVTKFGRVFCWGRNAWGELGNGTTTSSLTPVRVPGLFHVKQVTAGAVSTCALTSVGTVWCWGDNTAGALGNGASVPYSTRPVRVAGLTGVRAISGASQHVCALVADGRIACWGYNEYGSLGNGTLADSNVPVWVTGISNATQVATGEAHSCALTAYGRVKCWGYGIFGQLGDGRSTNSPVPVRVAGLYQVTSIGLGGYHSCAVLRSGRADCWGNDELGTLGDGRWFTNSATPVRVVDLSGAVAIDGSGQEWSTCALLAGGRAKCWGSDQFGQLGDGATNVVSVRPVFVRRLFGATEISAGGNEQAHTCALSAYGRVKCWGYNGDGQLGDGTTTLRPLPVRVRL